MVAALVQSSTSGTTDTQSATKNCPVPAGAAAGHVAVLELEIWLDTATDPTITWPAGFTQIAYVESTTDGFQRLYIALKVLSAADTGNYPMSWSGSYWNQAQCTLWSGIDNTTPLDVAVNTAVTASNTTMPAVSLTTVTAGCGVIHIVANENSATGTAPTGYTERQEANYLRTNTKVAGAAGTETPSGGSISVSTVKLGALVALRPAGSGSVDLSLARATETDAAQVWSVSKAEGFPAAAETSTASAVSLAKPLALAAGAETDSARALSMVKTWTAPAAAEADAASPWSAVKAQVYAVPISAEAAQPLSWSKTPELARATEADTAIPAVLTPEGAATFGLATETDVARALVLGKGWTALSASESDQALLVSLSKAQSLAVATETGTARAMAFSKSALFGRALEADAALSWLSGAAPDYTAPVEYTAATLEAGGVGVTRSGGHTAVTRPTQATASTRS